jgi:S-formylglutathione hydrolase FrmB
MSEIEILSTTSVTSKGGLLHRVKHSSVSTQTDMVFAVFLPAIYAVGQTMTPAIYWLSGLTCTDQKYVC